MPPFLSGGAGMLRPRSVERETILKSDLAFLAHAAGGFGCLGRLGRGLSSGSGGGGGRGRFGLGCASATASAGGGSCRSSRVRFAHILFIIRFRLRFVWSPFNRATARPKGISHARETKLILSNCGEITYAHLSPPPVIPVHPLRRHSRAIPAPTPRRLCNGEFSFGKEQWMAFVPLSNPS